MSRPGFHGRNELWEVDFSKRRKRSSSHEIRAILESRKSLYTAKRLKTLVHPREVFTDAIKDRAVAVIVAHNHPSGTVNPSSEDHAVTRSLQEAGDILGIRVLDHIVFAGSEHYSFLENGEL